MARAAVRRAELGEALREYLLAIADDELILGHRHSEWTGLGPDIESDVALSSIAQEEMGHARLFYQHVLPLLERPAEDLDAVVFDRPPQAFRNAVLLERPNSGVRGDSGSESSPGWKGDWGFTIVRLALYELADAVRLDALAGSRLDHLPGLALTLQREEKYHRMYAEAWLERLARATADSQARVQAALDGAWPEAMAFFEATWGEADLLAAGVFSESAARQAQRWRERAAELCGRLELRPPAAPAAGGGRRGEHSPDLAALLEEMTEVRRFEPGARW